MGAGRGSGMAVDMGASKRYGARMSAARDMFSSTWYGSQRRQKEMTTTMSILMTLFLLASTALSLSLFCCPGALVKDSWEEVERVCHGGSRPSLLQLHN